MNEIQGLNAHEFLFLYIKKAIVQNYREKYEKLLDKELIGFDKMRKLELINSANSITNKGKDKVREIESEIGSCEIVSTNLPVEYFFKIKQSFRLRCKIDS